MNQKMKWFPIPRYKIWMVSALALTIIGTIALARNEQPTLTPTATLTPNEATVRSWCKNHCTGKFKTHGNTVIYTHDSDTDGATFELPLEFFGNGMSTKPCKGQTSTIVVSTTVTMDHICQFSKDFPS